AYTEASGIWQAVRLMLMGLRAVNPSGPNFYAAVVRVRPVSKASELVRRPVKGEETGHRREEADRSTSPIIFFSKNEDFRPNADLLYRLVVAYASENFRKRNATADSMPGSDAVRANTIVVQ